MWHTSQTKESCHISPKKLNCQRGNSTGHHGVMKSNHEVDIIAVHSPSSRLYLSSVATWKPCLQENSSSTRIQLKEHPNDSLNEGSFSLRQSGRTKSIPGKVHVIQLTCWMKTSQWIIRQSRNELLSSAWILHPLHKQLKPPDPYI